jgi:twitching motility protein PilT
MHNEEVDMSGEQQRIEVLLDEVVKRKASDLHLQVGLPPMIRVDGALMPISGADSLDEEAVETLLFAILDADQKQILLKDKEFDFSFAYGELGRFRVNAFHERGNMAAALRLIPNEIMTTEQLGLPEIVSKLSDYPRGLVLVTGPTGSGKSTTLAAMVGRINSEKAMHIITIEDPIEYTHKSHKSVVVQREVHYDTYSFSAALRSALREDPDVVLLGEMRDLETIASAITIAETGHLVLATLHTNSAAQSIDRMIDVFPPHQQPQIRSQLSNILMAVVSQRLIPAISGGRIAAAEILIGTPAVRNIIREGKTHQLEAVIQTGSEYGMQSMDKTLVSLIHAGTITYEEARNYAVDLDEIDRLMRS